MKAIKKNKKGVSLMISYVLLIFITISLSIGVYIWLKDYAAVGERIDCKDGTSLSVEKYTVEQKGVNKIINISIKNNGLFNVSGFLISAGNNSKKMPMQLLWHMTQPQAYPGYFDFEPELSPGQIKNAEFNVTDLDKIEIIQMQPYIYKKNKIDKVFCEQEAIKQVILINPGLIPGLVSWWKLDGNVIDYGTGGNDGIIRGNPVYAKGELNQGLDFDGVDDYVNMSDSSSLDITGALTISAWVNMSDLIGQQSIVGKYVSGGSSSSYRLIVENGGNVAFGISNEGGSFSAGGEATSSNILLTNIWYHIVGVYIPSTSVKIYIDSIEKGSDTTVTGSIFSGSVGFGIGADGVGTSTTRLNGLIDEVAIYNKALTEWEVLQLYNSYNITSE